MNILINKERIHRKLGPNCLDIHLPIVREKVFDFFLLVLIQFYLLLKESLYVEHHECSKNKWFLGLENRYNLGKKLAPNYVLILSFGKKENKRLPKKGAKREFFLP